MTRGWYNSAPNFALQGGDGNNREADPCPAGHAAMTEETLFAAALEQATPEGRAAFLEEACAGDAALRRRVEALLASHDQAGFLQTPAVHRAAAELAAKAASQTLPVGD